MYGRPYTIFENLHSVTTRWWWKCSSEGQEVQYWISSSKILA